MRTSSILHLAVAVMLAASASQAAAQADPDRVITLDSLRASVTRSLLPVADAPVAVTSLAAPSIQGARATVGLDEALVAVPGVLVNNRYNFSLGSRIAIRGLGARAAFGVRGVRIIADGIPLTMPDGQTNLNNLDLGAAGRIQVIRGPASALYGNAAGGVIAIETELPPGEDLATEARVLIGDLGRGTSDFDRLRKGQFKAAYRRSDFDALLSVARLEVDGYRDFSRTRQSLVNLVGHQQFGTNTRIGFVLNGIDQPVAESPGALPIDSARLKPEMAWPNNVRTGSGEATRQLQAGVTLQRLVAHGRVDLSVYALGRSLDNALPFGFIALSRQAAGARALTAQTATISDMPLDISVGVDLESARDDRREFDNVDGGPGDDLVRDQVDRVESIGPFAQASLGITSRLTAMAGLRFDAVRFATEDSQLDDGVDDSGDRTLTALSPVLGVTAHLSTSTTAYANVATSFQTPTTTELINAPPEPGKMCCPGGFNPNLEPERATSFEVGLRGQMSERASYEVALYRASIRNTLVPFQVEDVEAREFFRNAGRSRHQGFEAGLRYVADLFDLNIAATITDFRFTDDGDVTSAFEDNRVPGVAPFHLFAGVALQPYESISIDTEFEHTSSYYADDANTAENPAANVITLRVSADTRIGGARVTPFLALNNALDEQYYSSVVVNAFGARYFEPAPGRSFHIGLSVATGGWAR